MSPVSYPYEAPQSQSLFDRASVVTPGGVNSPVRAFRAVGGTPPIVDRGAGARLWDVDGREYLDFCMAFGPLILGHGNEAVRAAVDEALGRGVIVPGKPDASLLVQYLRGLKKPQMPAGGAPLSVDELHLIREWIAAARKKSHPPAPGASCSGA